MKGIISKKLVMNVALVFGLSILSQLSVNAAITAQPRKIVVEDFKMLKKASAYKPSKQSSNPPMVFNLTHGAPWADQPFTFYPDRIEGLAAGGGCQAYAAVAVEYLFTRHTYKRSQLKAVKYDSTSGADFTHFTGNLKNILPGDIMLYSYNIVKGKPEKKSQHFVVVSSHNKEADSINVAEGNLVGHVHYGRVINRTWMNEAGHDRKITAIYRIVKK